MSNASQLALNLTPRLAYSAKNFILHTGVSSLLSEIVALLETHPPKFSFVYGVPRSGKTHMSIALSDKLISRGMKPVLLDGEDFKKVVLNAETKFFEKETLVVDDSDHLFSDLLPGDSGPIVRFFELLRLNEVGLVLFSSKTVEELPCDQHILSRLKASAQMQISAPDFESLQKVVDRMAKQRGLALGGRRLSFLEKRVSREISEIENYLERLDHLSEVLGKKVSFKTLGDALKPVKSLVF
jgi:chromosomal replication initiation ATPase DnaA